MKDVKYCLTFAHDPATFHTVGNAGEEGRRRSDGDLQGSAGRIEEA
jgi:hypothetical protein